MNEITPAGEIPNGELLGSDCQENRRGCTNTDVTLVEDPYEADVNNTPGVLILSCPACLDELCLEI